MHEHSLVERHKHREMDAIRKVEEDEDRDISLKDLSKKLQDFAKARDWEKYHTPRNLLLAMVGEVGELSEIFQWKGESIFFLCFSAIWRVIGSNAEKDDIPKFSRSQYGLHSDAPMVIAFTLKNRDSRVRI